MFIAKKLRQDNIAEYVLYMWQVEDIIRAHNLSIDAIEEQIVNKFDQPEDVKSEIKAWYEGLIEMMRMESKIENGHLTININTIQDLTELHLQLLETPNEADYISAYYKTLPFIVELRAKTENKNIPELETCFAAMYGFLLMRLKKQEISGETQAAISQIGSLLRMLSLKYKQYSEGKLDLN